MSQLVIFHSVASLLQYTVESEGSNFTTPNPRNNFTAIVAAIVIPISVLAISLFVIITIYLHKHGKTYL